MALSKDRLKELDWNEQIFQGESYMIKKQRVLRNISGSWAVGRIMFGLPHFTFDTPTMNINSEEELLALENNNI